MPVYPLIGPDCIAAPYLSSTAAGVDQSIVGESDHIAASMRQRRLSPHTKRGKVEEVKNGESLTVDPRATLLDQGVS